MPEAATAVVLSLVCCPVGSAEGGAEDEETALSGKALKRARAKAARAVKQKGGGKKSKSAPSTVDPAIKEVG